MKKLIAFILSTSLAVLPVTVKAASDVNTNDNSVCVNNILNSVLSNNGADCQIGNISQILDKFESLDFCENYKDCLDKLISDKFGFDCEMDHDNCFGSDCDNQNSNTQQPPESKPETQPEQKPEQKPETQPEQKPEDNTNNNSGISGIENSEYVNRVISLVNQERQKMGLSALKADTSLSKVALVRAKETVKSFSHTRPNGQSCFTVLDEYGIKYSGAGENIAYGQSSPEEVVNAWMNSEGHRANILNANFTKIGVGCHKNGSTLYWAQMFTY